MDVKLKELYQQQLASLPAADRLKLIEMLAQGLSEPAVVAEPPKRSLLELEGLGAEIWQGIDAQEYVNQLREEWDHRP